MRVETARLGLSAFGRGAARRLDAAVDSEAECYDPVDYEHQGRSRDTLIFKNSILCDF